VDPRHNSHRPAPRSPNLERRPLRVRLLSRRSPAGGSTTLMVAHRSGGGVLLVGLLLVVATACARPATDTGADAAPPANQSSPAQVGPGTVALRELPAGRFPAVIRSAPASFLRRVGQARLAFFAPVSLPTRYAWRLNARATTASGTGYRYRLAASQRAAPPATAVEVQVEVQRVRPDQRVESVGPEELGWQPVQGLRTSRGAQVYHSSSLESVSYHFDDGAYVVNAYLYRSCPARSADVVAEGVCLSANEIGAILRGFSIVKWGNP
jgi:hypothetical protein